MARAIGIAVAACSSVVAFTSSPPTRLVSATPAPPAAMILIARLLETVFIFCQSFRKSCLSRPRLSRWPKASTHRFVLDARIERIVNESGARHGFVIIFGDQRKASAD